MPNLNFLRGDYMSTIIAGILLEGMKTWNSERRLSFEKKYYHIIKRIIDAENSRFPTYTDAELLMVKEEESIFLEAYHMEAKSHTEEVKSA